MKTILRLHKLSDFVWPGNGIAQFLCVSFPGLHVQYAISGLPVASASKQVFPQNDTKENVFRL